MSLAACDSVEHGEGSRCLSISIYLLISSACTRMYRATDGSVRVLHIYKYVSEAFRWLSTSFAYIVLFIHSANGRCYMLTTSMENNEIETPKWAKILHAAGG